MERQTGTNFQSQTHLEDEQEEEQDGDDNISIASSDVYNNSGSLEMQFAVKQSYPNISKITGGTPFTKQKRKLPEPDVDVDFMNKLKEKLNSKKDGDQLYGDLLATKLRRLSSSSKLCAKHEIDNIMFKYMLQNEEDQQENVQAIARDQFTSPRPTPSTPIQADSPVYHRPYQQPSYQQQTIRSRQFLNINSFQTQQESNVNQTQPLQACLITTSHQNGSCLIMTKRKR